MRIEHDVPLAPLTTLRLGGIAKRFVRIENEAILLEAVQDDAEILVLGGGSNIVIGDSGWNGLVAWMGIQALEICEDIVTAGAGLVWDDLVDELVHRGLAGIECLSGIPGTVGATPVQNVGAYGQEVADTIVSVRALDRETLNFVVFTPAECGFEYRTSIFKHTKRWIIVEVKFRLLASDQAMPVRYPELAKALNITQGGRAPLALVRDTVIALRRRKGMVIDPGDPDSRSAGSFFSNPILDAAIIEDLSGRLGPEFPSWPVAGGIKLSAAWLLERAGFRKGYDAGNIAISSKHSLALITRKGATTTELLALAHHIQDCVRAGFGVELVIEPVIVQQ